MSKESNSQRKILRGVVKRKLQRGRGNIATCKVNETFTVSAGAIFQGLMFHLLDEVLTQLPEGKHVTSGDIVKTIKNDDDLNEVFGDIKFVLVNEND
jgi:hypothetical protein